MTYKAGKNRSVQLPRKRLNPEKFNVPPVPYIVVLQF